MHGQNRKYRRCSTSEQPFSPFSAAAAKHLLVQRRIQLEIKMLRRVIVAVFFATAGQDAGDAYHRSTLRNLMRQDTQILRMADQFVNRAHTEFLP